MKAFKCLHKLLFLLVIGFFLSFMCIACGDDENNESVTDPSKNTTDIAVTGIVDKYGCTYANISGYANLNLLPATDSGNPEIGIELYKEQEIDKEITSSMTGNRFSVRFNKLYPDSEFKYRSFVKYGGLTHYGEYRTFTTKSAYNVTSTGDVSVACYTATITIRVQQWDSVDEDIVNVGIAYATSKDAIQSDGDFRKVTVFHNIGSDVEHLIGSDVERVITLSGLSENTTYYYASFTSFNGRYAFSNIKSFTTKKLELVQSGAVDLGLSVKWASHNVGASSPEGYGGYYAWGETEEKSSYYWEDYKYYNNSTGDFDYIGSNISGTQYDVAHVKWGGSWRMPTLDEIKELVNKCSWKWTSLNGVNGQLVTGPNGNSIFLPAAGYRNGTDFERRGAYVVYWSATLDVYYSYHAYGLFFNFNDHAYGGEFRYYGLTVRPVTE